MSIDRFDGVGLRSRPTGLPQTADRAALRRAVESTASALRLCASVANSTCVVGQLSGVFVRTSCLRVFVVAFYFCGNANTTIVGAPGFLSVQKFDGLPDATAMYWRPPTA